MQEISYLDRVVNAWKVYATYLELHFREEISLEQFIELDVKVLPGSIKGNHKHYSFTVYDDGTYEILHEKKGVMFKTYKCAPSELDNVIRRLS